MKNWQIMRDTLVPLVCCIILSFFLISCQDINVADQHGREVDPIIEINNIEVEAEITKSINRLGESGRGFAYYADGWIYFSRRKDINFGDVLDIGELYKMREDGSEIIKLSNDAASSLFVKDDWLYYINDSDFRTLYRIRTDGSDRTQIHGNHRMFNFIYLDNWLYFEEYLHKKGQDVEYYGSPGTYLAAALSRMRLDGSDYQRVMDMEVGSFNYQPPYFYVRDHNFNSLYVMMRIHENSLDTDQLTPDEVNYEVILEHPVSGTFFVTSDHHVIQVPFPIFTEDGKRYIVADSAENAERKYLKQVDLDLFNIKDGWIYGIRSEFDEKINLFNVEIFRVDKNREETLATFTNDRNTRMNIVGDWILYNAYGVKYGLRLDGKEHKQLVEPYQTIGDEEKKEAREKLAYIDGILDYLFKEGHYNGETLNFLTIKALENKYLIKNFGILSESGRPGITNEDRVFYQLTDLIEMTSDEIVSANILMEEIERLKVRFEYLKSIVENKEAFVVIGQEEIETAMEMLDEIGAALDDLYQKEYIITDYDEKRFIDLRHIDEAILFEEIETTSFAPIMQESLPNMIPMEMIVVMNKSGEFNHVEHLLELSPQEIIDLGIQIESIVKMKADFDYIKDVIEKHEGI